MSSSSRAWDWGSSGSDRDAWHGSGWAWHGSGRNHAWGASSSSSGGWGSQLPLQKKQKYKQPDEPRTQIPAEFVQLLADVQPVCPFFGTKTGCRKGKRCTLRHHDIDDAGGVRLPHGTRVQHEDGSIVIVLRPPLWHGLEKYFLSFERPMTVSHGKHWRAGDSSSDDLVTYMTIRMVDPCLQAAAAVKTSGHADFQRKPFYRGQSTKVFSGYLLHGTSIESGLAILKHGSINTSPGMAGEGVYGFEVSDTSPEALAQTWKRCSTGGYNRGAAFLLKCHAILCKTTSADVLAMPQGVIGVNKDQFAASPSTIEYISVTFHRDGLISAIGSRMDQIGYSAALHSALVQIQQALADGSTLPSDAAEALRPFLRGQETP